MKVVSIIEPWASLIKEKVKYIETRSWKTNYRGKIYIHASLKKVPKKDERINNLITLLKDKDFKYGHIIAEATLVDCIYMDEEFISKIKNNNQEYICGEYSIGRYAWVLEDIKELSKPIPAKGSLGIWNYND
ncbi:MAG: ASCH domain-containing protein [Firmicutes bacterium]|nr:ASCH domain-containing protein [Bacillota bacterium]